MEQQIRFCKTSDGVRIAYATLGEGSPLVWTPGWISHLELSWENPASRATFEAYGRRFLLVRYDKRGTGLSDRDMTDYSIDARVKDLEAVVGDLKLRRFALMGVSEGGPVAIAYAARHPRHVSRLVLYGTFARGAELARRRRELGDALMSLIQAEWGLGTQTMAHLLNPEASSEAVEGIARTQREAATPEAAAAMIQAMAEIDVSHLLPKISAPTLVVHGREDKAIPFELGRELAGGIRDARFFPFDGGHIPMDADTGRQIGTAIRGFLADAVDQTAPPSAKPSPGALVTILFTDMEGSTSLTQRLGDAQAQELLRAHNTIVRDALKAHAGNEIKHTGDGIMASFASASGALECAIAIQRAFAERNTPLAARPEALVGRAEPQPPATEPIRVRIGLNAGEPVAEDADLFGTAVQLAARVCAQAQPAQILVPEGVRHLVAGKGFLFSDQGDIALRGFEDPVRLYEVRWREEA